MFELIRLLTASGVDYVLVGGLAVALHGYRRLTMDVDVVLAMTPDNLQRFVVAAKSAGLRPVIPVEIETLADPAQLEQWHLEKGMLAFGLRGAGMMATSMDVLVRPRVDYAELRRDAVWLNISDMSVPVASIDHLIIMKTDTGRSRDAIDIEELKKIRAAGQS